MHDYTDHCVRPGAPQRQDVDVEELNQPNTEPPKNPRIT